jgi:hypothetical protein
MPDSQSVLDDQSNERRRLTSITLQGVPWGFEILNVNVPSQPMILAMLCANNDVISDAIFIDDSFE